MAKKYKATVELTLELDDDAPEGEPQEVGEAVEEEFDGTTFYFNTGDREDETSYTVTDTKVTVTEVERENLVDDAPTVN